LVAARFAVGVGGNPLVDRASIKSRIHPCTKASSVSGCPSCPSAKPCPMPRCSNTRGCPCRSSYRGCLHVRAPLGTRLAAPRRDSPSSTAVFYPVCLP
jgi:hypothetical protein